MGVVIELAPWLIAMVVLTGCSAFFSASEAALFSLQPGERRRLSGGGHAQRLVVHLLADPDRLLSAVLFCNLVVNIAYFALASIVSLRLEKLSGYGQSATLAFALGSLLTIIFFSEMLPKSVGVLQARWLSVLVAVPLAFAVRVVDPLMPLLRLVNVVSRRLFWPGFRPEVPLAISDLERAIELSTRDAQLMEQERAVLRNIVALSDIRADEWMRPRTQFVAFRPPVALADLGGKMTPSGYLLVTEPDSEEVALAINLQQVSELPDEHLEHYADPVVYVPWCSTVASVLEAMQRRDRRVAAVVNEYGETIGILTFEDLMDTLFTYNPSRSRRLWNRNPIHWVAPNTWVVPGMTSVRRMARYFNVSLPPSKSVTIGGVVQEQLQRLAKVGDRCNWGPFSIFVREMPERGHMLLEVHRIDQQNEEPQR